MQQQAIGPIAKWAAEKVVEAAAGVAARRIEKRVKQMAMQKVTSIKRRGR